MSKKYEGKEQEYLDIEDEEVNIEHVAKTPEESDFDAVVTALEELLLDEHFQEMQNAFFDQHCEKFEESKENKLEYTQLFDEYNHKLEHMIQTKLSTVIPEFTMHKLEEILGRRPDELSGEVFDTLMSLGDFEEFKESMLTCKRQRNAVTKSGKVTSSGPSNPSASTSSGLGGLAISGKGMGLDLCITGSNLKSNKSTK